MKKKGFSVILMLLGILILAGSLIAGVYYFGTLKNKPQNSVISQTPQPTLNETANWKTYTNQTYGVSLKYPPSESVYKCGGESTSKSGMGGLADGSEKDCVFMTESQIRLDFFDSSFEEMTTYKEPIVSSETSTVLFGKRVYTSIHEVSKTDSERNKQVYFEHSPTKTINLSGRYNDSTSITLFDTILSTFKFTN